MCRGGVRPAQTTTWVTCSLRSQRVSDDAGRPVRIGGFEDTDSIGRLLHDFNREFNEPTPSPSALADRFKVLLKGGDTLVLLAGDGPDGLAVLRFRRAIWSSGFECSLAELYVVPHLRHLGIGRALMGAVLHEAQGAGPTRWMSASMSPMRLPAGSTRASGSPTGQVDLTDPSCSSTSGSSDGAEPPDRRTTRGARLLLTEGVATRVCMSMH